MYSEISVAQTEHCECCSKFDTDIHYLSCSVEILQCEYSPAGHHRLSLLVAVGLCLLWSHRLLVIRSQAMLWCLEMCVIPACEWTEE